MAKQRHSTVLTITGAIGRSFRRAFSSTTKQTRELGGTVRRLQKRQKDLLRDFEAGKGNIAMQREYIKVNEELREAERRLKRINRLRSAKRTNMAVRDTARSGMFAAGAVAAGLSFPIRKAVEFEDQMVHVKSIAGATDEEFGRLQKTARALGRDTRFSATQSAEGMQFLAMSGFDTNETISAMPGLLDLASVGQIELAEASDIATNILSGFNMEAAEIGRVGDVMTNTTNNANVSMSELGESMKEVAPVAANFNMGIEETASIIGTLGNAGMKGTQSGVALRNMLVRLAAPSGQAAGMLEELGIQTRNASGDLRGLPTILQELEESTRDMGTAQRGELVSTIFGLRSTAAASRLMGEVANGSLATLTERVSEQGTAAEIAAEKNETGAGKLAALMSQVEDLSIEIGTNLLPPVLKLAEQIGDIIVPVTKWISSNEMLSGTLGDIIVWATAGTGVLSALTYGLTFVFGGAIKAAMGLMGAGKWIGKVTGIAGKLVPVLKFLGGGILKIVGVLRTLSVTLLTSPLFWVGAAIAGIAFLIWKNWDTLGPKFAALWDGITSGLSSAWTWIKGAAASTWDFLKSVFRWTPMGLIMRAWGAVFDWFRDKFTWFDDLVERVIGGVLSKIKAAKDFLARLTGGGDDEDDDPPDALDAPDDSAPGPGGSGPSSGGGFDFGSAGGGGGGMPQMRQAPQDNRRQNFTITISQSPGESADELVERIMERLRENDGDNSPMFDNVQGV